MNARITRRRRAAVVGAAATMAVVGLAGCSGDRDDDAAPTTTGLPSAVLQSPLVADGEQICTDEEGDPTVSAEVQAAPPIEQPGLDLLEGRATLTEDDLTVTFSLVGAPDPESDPTFILFVGMLEDTEGFEVAVDYGEGLWVPELTLHSEGFNSGVPLPAATADVDGATVTVTVPVRALPLIRANQPLVFGTSGTLRDAEGAFLDNRGEPVDDVEDAASVLDDCFGGGGG